MLTSTTKLFTLAIFAIATFKHCAATTTDATIAEISVDMAPAKLTLSGKTSATNDNWVGGETSLTVTNKVEVTAASTSITIGTKVLANTHKCELNSTSPSAEITVTLALPDAFITALDTLGIAVSGLPSAAELKKPFTFKYAGDADGVSVLLSDVAVGALKTNLQMTGSDVKIEVKKEDIVVKQAGMAVPMTATVTLMDPAKITIPLADACGDGQSTVCANDSPGTNLKGRACKVFCSAIKSIVAKPAFAQTIDLARKLNSGETSIADESLIAVGDVTAVCESPAAAPSPAQLSAGSTPTVSFATVITGLMLLSAFNYY